MRYFIINTKNYLEASGRRLDLIASYLAMNKDFAKTCRIYLAVPAFDLRYLHSKYPKLNLLTQHLDVAKVGSSTGALVPELARVSGASGSIVNHSEHRIVESSVIETVNKLRTLNMLSVVCARNEAEVSQLSKCNPDFIAVEPPELIGTGNAVSIGIGRLVKSASFSTSPSTVMTTAILVPVHAPYVEFLRPFRILERGDRLAPCERRSPSLPLPKSGWRAAYRGNTP